MTGHRQLFVVGFPRSGTTWISQLVSQLPRTVVLEKSGLFHALQDLEQWWRTEHQLTTLAGKDHAGNFLAEQDLCELLRPVCSHAMGRLATALPETELVVEPTPENLEFEQLIRGVFPDAYFLHVIRDPRDALCSMRRAANAWENGFPGRPIHIANRWREYMRCADRLERGTERYLETRYEDMLAAGPEELYRIVRWLGLSATTDDCKAAHEQCTLERMKKESGYPQGFFGSGRAGGWRDELGRGEVRLVEYLLGEEMERRGYPREHPRSRDKPLRLKLHEWFARRLGGVRRGLSGLTADLRRSATHRREELRHTSSKKTA